MVGGGEVERLAWWLFVSLMALLGALAILTIAVSLGIYCAADAIKRRQEYESDTD